MDTVRVNLGPRSYDIAITSGDALGAGAFVRALPHTATALVVCDSNTQAHGRTVEAALAAAELRTGFATVPAGESSKCTDQLAKLYDALYDLAADRKTVVVAVGGEVV
jgi:3-dehydroquinate synthase